MQEISLLPIPYKSTNENNTDTNKGNMENANKSISENSVKKNKNTVYYIVSVVLSILTIFVISLSLFSGSTDMLDTDRIIEYIAGEFLGLDINNGSIFELWMQNNSISNKYPDNTEPSHPSVDKEESTDTENDSEIIDPFESEDPNHDTEQPPELPMIPDGEYPITEIDLSSKVTGISNMTDMNINISDFSNKSMSNDPYLLKINPDMTLDPLVLIIHTHGTEAYSEEGSSSYSDTSNIPRSNDTEQNIISVGKAITQALNENGIPAIHCDIMHDKESYQNSYERSAQTIERYLKRYPTIQYVFDIHRDSIIDDRNTKYRPVSKIDGDNVAQIMFVMGSNINSPEHVNWESNLTLAIKTTDLINSKYDSLTRTISLRTSSYNQQYTKGSLLVEIGSCGNTLEEAKRAGIIFANTISELIKTGW